MLDYAVITSSGERKINEDCVSYKENQNECVFVVADGLGAHGLGNIASEGACDIITEHIFEIGMEEAVRRVQKTLLEEQDKNGLHGKMKTTVTVMRIKDDHYEQLHLGDSRIYHFGKFKLLDQTKDHSVCQKLVDANLIRKDEVRHHHDRNKLLDVLGADWTVEAPYVMKKGQFHKKYEAILMCTDGFWEWIDEREMKYCLWKSKSAEEWLISMEKIILKNGKGNQMDNYSAIAVIYRR